MQTRRRCLITSYFWRFRKAWSTALLPGVDHLAHTHDLAKNAFSRGAPAHGAHLADELELFRYKTLPDGRVEVVERNLVALHEAILAPKYNFGAPRVAVQAVRSDGTLELLHDHGGDGRGLDPERAARVLDYLGALWRRPIELYTADGDDAALKLRSEPAAA